MATPQALLHALLRPTVLHIFRAAGFQGSRSSVIDAATEVMEKYIQTLMQYVAMHAEINGTEMEPTIQDVRMAMQDCGVLLPEKVFLEQEFDGVEDTRGVDGFIAWAKGPENREIRRIALEGPDGAKEDYLTVLKKKHSTADEESRYHGTMLGKPSEPRIVKVEGGDITSVKEWAERLKASSNSPATMSSRAQSSALSSVGDQSMFDMDF